MTEEEFKTKARNYIQKARAAGVSPIGMGRFLEMKYAEFLQERKDERARVESDRNYNLREREVALREQGQWQEVDQDGDGIADYKFNPTTGQREDYVDLSSIEGTPTEEAGMTQPTSPTEDQQAAGQQQTTTQPGDQAPQVQGEYRVPESNVEKLKGAVGDTAVNIGELIAPSIATPYKYGKKIWEGLQGLVGQRNMNLPSVEQDVQFEPQYSQPQPDPNDPTGVSGYAQFGRQFVPLNRS